MFVAMFLVAATSTAPGSTQQDPTSVEYVARSLNYAVLSTAEIPAFCSGSNTQFDALKDARDVICAHAPKVTSTEMRSKKHSNDSSWTVRIDELEFSTEPNASDAITKLLAMVPAPLEQKLQLSWCPRSYFWSGTKISMISASCGSQLPFCEVSRVYATKSAKWEAKGPRGIIGGEGGAKSVVATVKDVDVFPQCALIKK